MAKRILFVSLLLISSVSILSCSSDADDEEGINFSNCSLDGPDFSISEVDGNWTAIQANYDIPGTSQQIGVVTEDGTVTLNVQANGSFTLLITESGQAGETTTGDQRSVKDYSLLDMTTLPTNPKIYRDHWLTGHLR